MDIQRPGSLDTQECPDAQRLAAYCEGALGRDAAERVSIETHLADCAECREVVMETREYLQDADSVTAARPNPRLRLARIAAVTGILAAAAALMFAVLPLRLHRPASVAAVEELSAALAAEPTRGIEARTSLNAAYAPARSPERGAATAASPDVRIAAAKIEKLADRDESAELRAALGLAYLAAGNLDGAVTTLEAVASAKPSDARVQLDLSAAYLTRADTRDRPEDWSRALAAAERSISADHRAPAAYFNRALALEGLQLRDRAAIAWSEYLAHDASGAWAEEARRHVAILKTRAHEVGQIDHQQLRERIEDVLLPAWAQAFLAGRDDARDRLHDAALKSSELAAAGGDAMPLAETQAIERHVARGEHAATSELAAGHVLYAVGREHFQGERLDAAAELMARASVHFVRAGSPYRFWAPIYAAIAKRAAGAADRSLTALDACPIATIPERYVHLRGRWHWMRGAAMASLGRYDRARIEHLQAVSLFASAGELENLSANRTHLAEAEWFLGERHEAWRHELEALAELPRLRVGTRRNVILFIGATFALESQLPEAALHFESALVDSLRGHNTGSALTDALMQRAEVFGSLERLDAAKADLDQGQKALGHTVDAGTRDRSLAELQRARAHVLLASDPGRAAGAATSALVYFETSGLHARIAELYAVRAKSRTRGGDLDGAEADFAAAASAYESVWRGVQSPEDRLAAFTDQRDTYRDWIQLAVSRGQYDHALSICERGRAQTIQLPHGNQNAVDPVASRDRLGPDGAAVYYVVLPDRLVSWTLTAQGVSHSEHALSAQDVRTATQRIDRAIERGDDVGAVHRQSASVIDAALLPLLEAARSKRSVVLLPDGDLWRLPFAALALDAAPALAADRTIVLDQSLTTFLASSRQLSGAPLQAVLAVGDGHVPDSELPALAGANREAMAVGRLYPSAVTLIGADATRDRLLTQQRAVLHFSGHTVVNPGTPLLSRLLLAPGSGGDGSFFGNDILEHRTSRIKVVVLGSCQSSDGPFIEGEGPASVAAFFLASGVALVIASSRPVDDSATELLLDTHRQIVRGRDPARALLIAQGRFLSTHGARAPLRVWGSFAAYGGIGPV